MTDSKPFSERLLWARSEAGLTQKDLASKSGISLPQIVRYEAGRSTPRLGGALKLARVLGVDAYDLVPGLQKATHETAIELSDEENQLLQAQADELGVSVTELVRKIVMSSIERMVKDPQTRKLIEEKDPDIINRINAHNDDADDDLN